MNPRLKALHDQLQGLNNRASALAQQAEWSEDDRIEANGIEARIASIHADIESTNRLGVVAKGSDTFLNGFDGTNITSQVDADPKFFTMKEEADRAKGRETIWQGRAGTDLVGYDRKGQMMTIDAEGWGIPEAQFKAISEPKYNKAFGRFMQGKADRADIVALTEGADQGGGYLVPPQWLAQVIMRKPAPTQLLNYLRVLTATKDKVIVPRVNYDSDTNDIFTSAQRIQWIGETGPTPSATEPAFGDVEIPIYTGQFNVECSRNLLEDTADVVTRIIQDMAAQTYNLGIEDVTINGNGIAKPLGFLSNPGGTGLNAPSVNIGNPVTAIGLTNLVYGVPPQYADDMEKTIALMNRMSGFATFAGLQDGNGQFIYGLARTNGPEGMANPRLNQLFGYDVIYSAFMPNVGANNYPVAFGDFYELYTFCRRVGMVVEPYGPQDKSMLGANKVGWYFRFRVGGQTVQNRAVHIGKQA